MYNENKIMSVVAGVFDVGIVSGLLINRNCAGSFPDGMLPAKKLIN